MTKEDAISLLKQVNEILINSNSWLENTHEPLNQAFDTAIKALEQQPCDDCVSRKEVLKLFQALKDDGGIFAQDYIENAINNNLSCLPPVTPTQSWVPVSERLPEKCGDYLCSLYYAVPPYHVFHPENDIYIHDVSVQKFDGKSFISSVKAWQPLPKPYEEKRGNENESIN